MIGGQDISGSPALPPVSERRPFNRTMRLMASSHPSGVARSQEMREHVPFVVFGVATSALGDHQWIGYRNTLFGRRFGRFCRRGSLRRLGLHQERQRQNRSKQNFHNLITLSYAYVPPLLIEKSFMRAISTWQRASRAILS